MSASYCAAPVNGTGWAGVCVASLPAATLPADGFAIEQDSVALSFRVVGDETPHQVDSAGLPAVAEAVLAPWRTFRWWYGQRHYSGTYWSSTQGGHVIYESRLELSGLIAADFARPVTAIAAQPFLLQARVDGVVRSHIPDFLLATADGPLVVEVKPGWRLERPRVVGTLGWAQQLITELGWRYQVWSEPPQVEAANLAFLAGYRIPEYLNAEVLAGFDVAACEGARIGEVLAGYAAAQEPLARAVLLHLLWQGRLCADLSRPLQPTSILSVGVRR